MCSVDKMAPVALLCFVFPAHFLWSLLYLHVWSVLIIYLLLKVAIQYCTPHPQFMFFHCCINLTLSSHLPQMSFDPGMLHNNGHSAYANGTGAGIRETGVVEKLLTSYGFIQCSERQARLFFHCSQYNGNLQELKIGGKWLLTNYSDQGWKYIYSLIHKDLESDPILSLYNLYYQLLGLLAM